jgi:hypothetical protein
MWRLGGNQSSFAQDFVFSKQHDARTIAIDANREVISFLDNAADIFINSNTSAASSAMIVELDRKTMHAKVLDRFWRPDGNLTLLRGNHQVLGNGNSFVCWSENGYISEHAPDGTTLMEAKFAGERFVTYRGYKFDFVGAPDEPPTVKGFAHGMSRRRSSTAIYVSWNGATEVRQWRFFGTKDGDVEVDEYLPLGEWDRTGFETIFYADGYWTGVYAQALDEQGEVIGESDSYRVDIPAHWEETGGRMGGSKRVFGMNDVGHWIVYAFAGTNMAFCAVIAVRFLLSRSVWSGSWNRAAASPEIYHKKS